MNVAVLVIVLHGQVTCEPQIRSDLIPQAAEVHCMAADRAPLTSLRPKARPIVEEE
jgi:hypothetical protein|tara:strand:+ start:2870 stop:3037 length:168 start_codon:yes stop_codon:yes gene_type:complete